MPRGYRYKVGSIYPFEHLNEVFDKEKLFHFRTVLAGLFIKVLENWSDQLNSEWTVRTYLGAKLILASTVFLNINHYLRKKKVYIMEPYLLYYSLLNCCRTINFIDPSQSWESGKLVFDSHHKIITKACAFIQTVDKNTGIGLLALLKRLKKYRELFSYRYPSSGLKSLEYNETFLEGISLSNIAKQCNLICEISQFASECFEILIRKKLSGKTFSYDYPTLEKAFEYNGRNYFFLDKQDARRLYYTIDDIGHPVNIYHSIKPGWVEDFFNSWYLNKSNRLLNSDWWEISVFRFCGIDGT